MSIYCSYDKYDLQYIGLTPSLVQQISGPGKKFSDIDIVLGCLTAGINMGCPGAGFGFEEPRPPGQKAGPCGPPRPVKAYKTASKIR